jgi:hypothetical protein
VSREVGKPETLEDVRYLAERDILPDDVRDEVGEEALGKLLRNEKVKVKGYGKSVGEEVEEAVDYEAMTVDELRAELASRTDEAGEPLNIEGRKSDLVARLRENDG